jgi:hypothetical protein
VDPSTYRICRCLPLAHCPTLALSLSPSAGTRHPKVAPHCYCPRWGHCQYLGKGGSSGAEHEPPRIGTPQLVTATLKSHTGLQMVFQKKRWPGVVPAAHRPSNAICVGALLSVSGSPGLGASSVSDRGSTSQFAGNGEEDRSLWQSSGSGNKRSVGGRLLPLSVFCSLCIYS